MEARGGMRGSWSLSSAIGLSAALHSNRATETFGVRQLAAALFLISAKARRNSPALKLQNREAARAWHL